MFMKLKFSLNLNIKGQLEQQKNNAKTIFSNKLLDRLISKICVVFGLFGLSCEQILIILKYQITNQNNFLQTNEAFINKLKTNFVNSVSNVILQINFLSK